MALTSKQGVFHCNNLLNSLRKKWYVFLRLEPYRPHVDVTESKNII